MKTIFLSLTLCLMTLIYSVSAQASGLYYGGAYAYATAKTQKNGAIFLVLENKRDKNIRIVSADTAIAERTELHTHIMDGDVMMMREVEHFDIPPGETLTLEPTGNHIMLMNIRHPLLVGTQVILSLKMDDGEEARIPIDVILPGTSPEDANKDGAGKSQ